MSYLTNSADILSAISELTNSSMLWIDTEIADWWTHTRRLSLIQVLSDTNILSENNVLIFDVLDKPDVIKLFSEQIIADSTIEKIFHNAPGDRLKKISRQRLQFIPTLYAVLPHCWFSAHSVYGS